VVSAARGNEAAMLRAIENLRKADAENRLRDAGIIRGAAIPEAAALEAIRSEKGVAVRRQIERLLKFHGWEMREHDALDRAVDFRALGVARYAASRGIRVDIVDPRLPQVF